MEKIKLLQEIGNEVCEGCGEDSDCGMTPDDCYRIQNALEALDEFLHKAPDQD